MLAGTDKVYRYEFAKQGKALKVAADYLALAGEIEMNTNMAGQVYFRLKGVEEDEIEEDESMPFNFLVADSCSGCVRP